MGPYLLLSRLGAGAMGRVYLGRSASGRLVAVKTIRLEYAEEADFRARFAQEVAAARRVSGVFTASVVAADPDAPVPWLATAYVPAPSLSRLVSAGGPLPVPAVRWLAAGCAEALDSIHTAGLVHRDLKPSNVLVSQDGPRVIDFGVARVVERVSLTTTRGSLGTPAYMAPEQARDTRRASAASDVFSLGSTLAYAATGHPPYRGETVTDILVRLATQPPDLTGLPAELAAVVSGCLAADPADRPSPAELLSVLAPHVHLDSDGPPELPAAALVLMEDFRHRPREPVRAAAAADHTVGSLLGATGSSAVSQPSQPSWPESWPTPAPAAPDAGAGGAGVGGAGVGAAGRSAGAGRFVAVLAALAAAVLLVAGGMLGGWLVRGDPPPGPAAGRPGPDGGPGRPPPPPPGDRAGGPPEVGVNQPHGDARTSFVVYGRGWPPGATVTVSLNRRASPRPATVDRAGAFNYVVNQDGEFFPDRLPQGRHTVTLTAADGPTDEVSFEVGGS